ncbi:WD40 repeat-like protein [Aspergillus japonicus CBS 114.51]|uniref:WD40 repeat-like protein n=1 Tax=Aspergillus japonicus CBS 114.51 TaxID=1448312 RepID=A0A8T8WLF8_ASPJA|nr:WD40 repeat-like protein [Aspergillus japonicus CBS 114.51]RAH76681.1 WD40 repeat-like protein [Aspergillus japonicus CBS 114.51]
MNSEASFTGYNTGFQVGQNPGQINSQFYYNYYNQPDDSKAIDPELDKQRIEKEKGGLLRDSYCWVLKHDNFKRWRDAAVAQMLWIKGDPGKGKTMLICGIIDELSKTAIYENINIAYVFCQATNNRINSATAVLKGLMLMLGRHQPSLQAHIPTRFLDNENGWFQLYNAFRKILQDPTLKSTYLMIDALDECTIDRNRLLEILEEYSSGSSHVKWIVSSRNWPSIERYLNNTTGIRLQLELNEDNLAAAVESFIKYKVEELTKRNKYNLEKRKMVENHLQSNAKGTFLWVALVCKQLDDISPRHLQKKLKDFPPGLHEFYCRMFNNIQDVNDDTELCLSLLGIVTTVYRPITLDELSLILELQEKLTSEDLQEIVKLCGSFITLQNCTIKLVHQSAQDFLLEYAPRDIAPKGIQYIHYSIFSKSLESVHTHLERDIYNLKDHTLSISEVRQPDPDPLATMQYACRYWVDHLIDYFNIEETTEELPETNILNSFLCQDFLHWLEALSLSGGISEGAKSILKLEGSLKTRTADGKFIHRVQDAYRFIIYHRVMLEQYPLQVYTSAIFFSPQSSITKIQYMSAELAWISGARVVEESWGACLQTLEGHHNWVTSVVFSHDSTRLASASNDKTIKLWDSSSGACLQTLEGHNNWVYSVVFSHDSKQIASASSDETIKLWDSSSGTCLQILKGHNNSVTSVAFSPDSIQLASASDDKTVKLWDVSSGACLHTLEGHDNWVTSVVFSHNSKQLASASSDKTIKLWDVSSRVCLQTLEGHNKSVRSVVFSPDSTQLASASDDKTVKLWDVSSGACLQTLESHHGAVCSVVFSYDATRLASASDDKTVKLWDVSSGACLQTLEGHDNLVRSVSFSHDCKQLASASEDKTVKLWDASSGACLPSPQALEDHSNSIRSVVFSHDFTRLASASWDKTVKLWDASSGLCLHTLEGHNNWVILVVFSHDSTQLASASSDKTIKLWDSSSGTCLQTLKGHANWIRSVVFSYNSTQLASASDDKTVKLWDASSGACLQTCGTPAAARACRH